MTREEIRLQVAISVIQGVLEAKHGVIGEVVPSVAVAIALRIADAFVEEWYKETKEQQPAGGSSEKPNSQWRPSEEQMKALNEIINILAVSMNPHENDYLFNMINGLRKSLKKL